MISPRDTEGRGWWVNWPKDLADDQFPSETTTGHALVPSSDIIAERVPHWKDGWTNIYRFAWTFPGYEIFGLEKLGDMANESQKTFDCTGWLPASLPLLRGALFFEQRKAAHTSTEMDMPWTAVLLEAIRLVASGKPPTVVAIAAQGVPVPGSGPADGGVCSNCDADISESHGNYCPKCGYERGWNPRMEPYSESEPVISDSTNADTCDPSRASFFKNCVDVAARTLGQHMMPDKRSRRSSIWADNDGESQRAYRLWYSVKPWSGKVLNYVIWANVDDDQAECSTWVGLEIRPRLADDEGISKDVLSGVREFCSLLSDVSIYDFESSARGATHTLGRYLADAESTDGVNVGVALADLIQIVTPQVTKLANSGLGSIESKE